MAINKMKLTSRVEKKGVLIGTIEYEIGAEEEIKMKASRDYCPKGWQHKHSFHGYSYWGSKHPKCSKCGWEDKTRLLEEYKDDNKN